MRIQIAKWIVLLCALALPHAVLAQSSVSNSTVFMSITGPSGGIEGEVTTQGRQGWHKLMAFSHEIISPRDSASGLPTGKRQHTPFKIVKLINKGTPKLLNTMVGNTPLYYIDISVWSPAAGGGETKVLTYRLSNAYVTSIRPWMPNKSDPSAQLYPPAEEITFTYQYIEVTYHPDNIIAQDEWLTGNADSTKSAVPKR
jgi:type VI secretion system secreted protein Hcp